jgi:hypothetical protein
MNAGQLVNVVVCATSVPNSAIGVVNGPTSTSFCPEAQSAFVVQSYLPFSGSQQFIDGLMSPFDQTVAASLFGFGFGLVVFFYLLGLKGSVILRPFWGGRY